MDLSNIEIDIPTASHCLSNSAIDIFCYNHKYCVDRQGNLAYRRNQRFWSGSYSLTVLPAKSDSDVMFCLQSYQGLMIDRSLVYQSYSAIRRIGLIHK